MSKLLRQNVGGTDYSMVGCTLSATCATPAATAAKVATLTDGDTLADGMSVTIQFTEGNTAASPLTLTVGGVTANICDSRGLNIGGTIWQAGNVVTFHYTFGKFLFLSANSLTLPSYVGVDVFATADDCPLGFISFFRVYEATANSPHGSSSNDFWYRVNKLDNAYIRITAFDVRSNRTYVVTKVSGTWGTWLSQPLLTTAHVTITTDTTGSGPTGYSINSEYIPISFRPTYDNYPTIIVCDANGYFYVKPFDWNNFVIKPNITFEGDLILQSRA